MTMEDALAVLLLPVALEHFELAGHARGLLEIPRVLALEPGRFRAPRFLRDSAALRTAKRLRFPGRPRLLVLYDPAQYPLARALIAHDNELELWYVSPDPAGLEGDRTDFDRLARVHAARTIVPGPDRVIAEVDTAELRERLRELEVINARAFIAGIRAQAR